MSSGCQVAGFFGVLSSELSVYTLTVITLERNYAITHAMHLNKRLSLRHAAYIMIGGWLFSILMAILPMIGISDYRKFAVCLPFETSGGGLAYIIFLMFINGIAFLILMGCYLKIYCSIRGSQAWNSNDSRIAKRMALLVFTDFLCWAPIAFFSLTAASGIQLISLEEAKIFTVFILPLNSCCNPFLYALLTKQFKKDCVMLCKSIEESRVTRGIGRCKHSSNFSNRHTPVNTNSAIEHNSKDHHQSCGCHIKQRDHIKIKYRINSALTKYISRHKKVKENKRKEHVFEPSRVGNNNKKGTNLSIENYSSSWSNGLKKNEVPASTKLVDKQQTNFWLLYRKASQDSNLSSSRHDSSATTASTSTFRISRSSVSSDISSAGSKGFGCKNDRQNSGRISSIKDKRNDRLPYTKITHHIQMEQSKLATGAWISSTVRDKQKYYKPQDTTDPGFTAIADDNTLYPHQYRPENLSCVYEQESYEEDDAQYTPEDKRHFLSPNFATTIEKNPIEGRKESTNSSKSTSPKDQNSTKLNREREISLFKDCKLSQLKKENSYDLSRCLSLTTLDSSLQSTSGVASRFPSEGNLCPQNLINKPSISKSIDCVLFSARQCDKPNSQRSKQQCSETTALMISDSEDDDVFLEHGKNKEVYETHFPINGDPEISYLIRENTSKHFRV